MLHEAGAHGLDHVRDRPRAVEAGDADEDIYRTDMLNLFRSFLVEQIAVFWRHAVDLTSQSEALQSGSLDGSACCTMPVFRTIQADSIE
jgi:predicted transcriptional regulator